MINCMHRSILRQSSVGCGVPGAAYDRRCWSQIVVLNSTAVCDLDPGVASKLANTSTRPLSARVTTLLSDFVLGGHNGDDRIVVRGIGPSLTASGATNALANLTLELRDSNGTLLFSKIDWQDNPAQVVEINTAELAPRNDLEAAIAARLRPGLYTALLAGLNNGTGLGLIEVYDLGL